MMLRHAVLALAIVLAALSGAHVAQAQGVGRGGLVPMPPITHPGTRPPGLHPPQHSIKRYPYWGYGGGYAPPLYYASYVPSEPTVVYQPIVVYSQPSEFAPSPSMELGLPPMPSVIPYPDGRYVLMGDGINSAYRWVWIPNPPSGPPEKSPPAVAPGPAASRGGALYRWVDDQDVVHYTQGWDAVPERYRSQVKLAGTR